MLLLLSLCSLAAAAVVLLLHRSFGEVEAVFSFDTCLDRYQEVRTSMIYSTPVLASVLGALCLVQGKIYFKEDFNSKDWEKR